MVYFLPCCHREINFNYLKLFQLNNDCEDPKKTAVKTNSSLVLMFDATPAGQEALKNPRVEFIRAPRCFRLQR